MRQIARVIVRQPFLVWCVPLLLSVTLSLIHLSRPGLWRDELSTSTVVTLPFDEFWHTVTTWRDAMHAPYYLVLRAWVAIAGDSEVSLRMPSVIGIAMAVALTAVIARRIADPEKPEIAAWSGVIAGVIFAILPAVSRYAQEARVYGLLAAAVLGATYALLRILDTPRQWQWWSAYGLLLVAVGAFQFVALLLTASAHGVQVLYLRWRGDVRVIARFTGLLFTVGVLLLPMVWMGAGQSKSLSALTSTPTFEDLTALPGKLLLSASVAGVLFAVALLAASMWSGRLWTPLLIAWGLLPIVFVFAVSQVFSLWVPRYFFFTLSALAILAGLFLARTSLVASVVIVLTIAVLGAPVQAQIRETDGHGADAQSMLTSLTQRSEEDDVIAYAAHDVRYEHHPVRYYLGDEALPVLIADPSREERRWCSSRAECVYTADVCPDRVWLIRHGRIREPLDEEARDAIRDFLTEKYQRTEKKYFPGYTLARYERKAGASC